MCRLYTKVYASGHYYPIGIFERNGSYCMRLICDKKTVKNFSKRLFGQFLFQVGMFMVEYSA